MDNIDMKIKEILSQDLNLSYKYKNMVRNTLKERKKVKNSGFKYVFKIISVACTCLIITTSIVFAKDIRNFIRNFFNTNKGIDTAIENGYIFEPDIKIDSANIEVKMENLLMDDYNLNFTLNLKFNENINAIDIQKIELPDMIIVDEENRILFCSNKETFDNYCKKHSLNYEYINFNDKYFNSGINWYIKSKDKNQNSLTVICNLYGENYPRSKKLSVNFNTMNLFNTENSENSNIRIDGMWNLEINIPEEFYNRNVLLYKVKSCSNPNVNISKAEVTNTGMKFELFIQEEKIYDENDSEEVINEKIAEANEKSTENLIERAEQGNYFGYYMGDFKKDTYVETEDGVKFYPSNSNTQESGCYMDLFNGIVSYWQTYNLTSYDATQNLKIYLQYKGEDIFIELER